MKSRILRKQYHARKVGQEVFIWDVHRLIRLSKCLTPSFVPLAEIAELDENWWYDEPDAWPSPRSLAEHMKLVLASDLACPILLSADGRLMDGMHRAVKALLERREQIMAICFPVTPEPDYKNISLDDLPYPDEEV